MKENWVGVGNSGVVGVVDPGTGEWVGWPVGDIMAVAEDGPEDMSWEEGGKKKERRRGWVGRPHGDLRDRTGQKRRGEVGEAMFLVKMVALGFSVMTLAAPPCAVFAGWVRCRRKHRP